MTSDAKVNMFKLLCGTIKLTLLGKHQKQTLIKFYRAIAVTMLLYDSKCWTLKWTINENNRGGSVVQRIKMTDPKQNEHYSKRNSNKH